MLKVGPYVIVEAVMKLTLIVMLAGCGSAGGDAVDLATDDFHRLGELQPDGAADDFGGLDMAIETTDLTTAADLAQRGDLATVQPDLLVCLALGTSCHIGDVCCAGQGSCGFSGVGATNDTCCVGIGQPCARLGDCCSPYTCKLVMGAFTCNP